MNILFKGYCIPLLLLFAACTASNEHSTTKEKFPVTSPLVIDTTYFKEYVAEIHSVQNVEIRARVKGYIEQIYVDEGKPVKAGQTMFRISSQEYKEELTRARARLNSAKADARSAALDIENTQILLERKIVSDTELKSAQAKLEALEAKVEEAKSDESAAALRLSLADIKAPFDGIINRIPYKKGSLIDEGTLLTSISNNKEVFAYFNVSEKEYLDFISQEQAGEKIKVNLLLANNQPHKYEGTIETIEGEFNKSTGNIAFRARFPNPKLVLKHGSSGKILLKTELKNALIIPQKSTFEIQEKMYVFTLDGQNKLKATSIVPKHRIPHLYVLESGLSTNDKIIYEGIQSIQEGDHIIPEYMPLKKIVSDLSQQ